MGGRKEFRARQLLSGCVTPFHALNLSRFLDSSLPDVRIIMKVIFKNAVQATTKEYKLEKFQRELKCS